MDPIQKLASIARVPRSPASPHESRATAFLRPAVFEVRYESFVADQAAETRRLLTHKAELLHSGGAAATEAVRAAWRDLDALADRVAHRFPLDDDATLRLRRDLQQRAHAIHAEEQAAADALAEVTRGR